MNWNLSGQVIVLCLWLVLLMMLPILIIIIFTVKNTKSYILIFFSSARGNQKSPKIHSQIFERSVYCNEYKTISENKNATNKYRYTLKSSNFIDDSTLFILIYSNANNHAKRCKGKKYYFPKDIIKNYNVMINGKNFCN